MITNEKGQFCFYRIVSGLPRIVMSTENYVEQWLRQSTLATPQALNPRYNGRYSTFSYKDTVRTLIFIKVSSLQADSSNKMKTFGKRSVPLGKFQLLKNYSDNEAFLETK